MILFDHIDPFLSGLRAKNNDRDVSLNDCHRFLHLS